MDVTFGSLRPHDRERFRDLLRYCFILTAEQAANWVADDMPAEWLVAGYRGQELLVGAIVQPMEFAGAFQATVGAIGGVATAAHVRGRGLARGLMAFVLEQLRDRGMPWSILHPFDFSFYHRLGWGQGTPMVKLSVAQPRALRRPVLSGSYRLVGEESWPCLDEIHRVWLSRGPGAPLRGAWEWRRVLHRPVTPRVCVVWESAAGKSYMVYQLTRWPGSPRQGSICAVHDWAWTTAAGRDALLTYLANHAGQVGRIDLMLSIDDPLTNLEGDGVERTFVRGPMTRIVHLAGVDSADAGAAGTTVDVYDELCPWNNSTFLTATGAKWVATPSTDAPSVRVSISELSSVLWGSLAPETAGLPGEIAGQESNRAVGRFRRLPAKSPFFLDWF